LTAAAQPKAAAATPTTSAPTSEAEVRGAKPTPATPIMATKEPATPASAVQLPAAEPEFASAPASSAVPPQATPEPAPVLTPAAVSASKPTPKTEPKTTEHTPTRAASLTPAQPASSHAGHHPTRIAFTSEGAALPEPAKGDLKQIASSLAKDPALRVQVMAYASGGKDASKARRVSLSRALAVRSFLIDQGVGSTRIDVRALGNTAESGPSDRVDLVVLSR
jgi:outer membrane protein OmpA-like peptidoglycan-associated protein